MIIGNFSYDFDRDTYTGEITTLTLQRGNVFFRPTEKAGDKEPDYRIVQEYEGTAVDFGAAWKRLSEKGREYLSVQLDDPSLASPVSAALFLSERDETATLVWQRQAKKAPAAEANSTATVAKARPRVVAARSPQVG